MHLPGRRRCILRQSGGRATPISDDNSFHRDGNGPGDSASLAGITPDGLHVYFTTGESLSADDTDNRVDVYERFGNTTTLVSDAFDATADASADFIYRGIRRRIAGFLRHD